MKIGEKLNYYGKDCEVLEFNKTHVLIIFESGSKSCVNKFSFEK